MGQSRVPFVLATRLTRTAIPVFTSLCIASSCRQPPIEAEPITKVAATALPTASNPLSFVTTEPPTEVFATLRAPLSRVEFPTLVATYPPDWPAELVYPEEFMVVETGLGVLPETAAHGWATKLRYEGNPQTAAELLSAFFASRGWQIAEKISLDSGGVLILLAEEGSEGTGIVVIDPDQDDIEHTRIVVTILD